METQTATRREVSVSTDVFIHGLPEIRILESEEKSAANGNDWLCMTIGKMDLYFDSRQDFKAFVGEMIKAVANLK